MPRLRLKWVFPRTIAGFFLGGGVGAGDANAVATVDKIVFATDTTAANASSLPNVRSSAGQACNATSGYASGGFTGGVALNTAKVTFATSTCAAVGTASLSLARYKLTGVSGGATKGYFLGGTTGARVATGDVITYATETIAYTASANSTSSRDELGGMSQGTTKGYASGGYSNAFVATTDLITFSTDTTAACTTANINPAVRGICGLSGSSWGYMSGGLSDNYVATANKITFSTDTRSAAASADLSANKWCCGSVSEGATKGYIAGGFTLNYSPVATADKITFSTDTRNATTSANLSQSRAQIAGVSDAGV